jgi:hypothetical protein
MGSYGEDKENYGFDQKQGIPKAAVAHWSGCVKQPPYKTEHHHPHG